MRRPCEVHVREVKPNGLLGKTIKKFSYVAVLCKKESDLVMAVRVDAYQNKADVWNYIDKSYPDWRIKAVHKLYDEDFREV